MNVRKKIINVKIKMMDCYFAGHTRPTVARHPVDWQAAAAARNKSNCAAQIGGSFRNLRVLLRLREGT